MIPGCRLLVALCATCAAAAALTSASGGAGGSLTTVTLDQPISYIAAAIGGHLVLRRHGSCGPHSDHPAGAWQRDA